MIFNGKAQPTQGILAGAKPIKYLDLTLFLLSDFPQCLRIFKIKSDTEGMEAHRYNL